jgi:hypothetical protein
MKKKIIIVLFCILFIGTYRNVKSLTIDTNYLPANESQTLPILATSNNLTEQNQDEEIDAELLTQAGYIADLLLMEAYLEDNPDASLEEKKAYFKNNIFGSQQEEELTQKIYNLSSKIAGGMWELIYKASEKKLAEILEITSQFPDFDLNEALQNMGIELNDDETVPIIVTFSQPLNREQVEAIDNIDIGMVSAYYRDMVQLNIDFLKIMNFLIAVEDIEELPELVSVGFPKPRESGPQG